MNSSLPATKRVLRAAAVLERTGLRPTALAEKISRGEFPAPIKISDSGRAVAWIEAEVDAWLEARVAKRDAARASRQKKV